MFFDSFVFKKETLLELLSQRKTQLPAQTNAICHNTLSKAAGSMSSGVDDIFIAINRRLHQNLLQRHIPHDYVERTGYHSRACWTRALPDHLLFFREPFEKGE